MARGGRGGRVAYVTTLEDYDRERGEPPIINSLRWALEELTGPRHVLFAVGGTIELKRDLVIAYEQGSYVTIAGQTAPGDGIQLKGYGLKIYRGAHDVIVRYLRIRPGYTSDAEWDKDALCIYGMNGETVYNVIVDHCSLEWAIDENANVESSVDRVTFQYCIFGEGSMFGHHAYDADPSVPPGYPHSMGFLASGPETGSGNTDSYLTLHHNLFISNDQRNPLLNNAGGTVHMVNNVIYNWGAAGMRVGPNDVTPALTPRVNLIGNQFIRGPSSHEYRYAVAIEALPDESFYVSDNFGPYREDPLLDDWQIVALQYGPDGVARSPAPPAKRRAEPWPTAGVPVRVQAAVDVVNTVARNVGANYPRLDAVDARLIQELEAGTGDLGFGPSVEDHQEHPVLAGGPAPTDTDGDGMPDEWETAQRLNPADPNDGNEDPDGDGYTNVEEYLNSTVGTGS